MVAGPGASEAAGGRRRGGYRSPVNAESDPREEAFGALIERAIEALPVAVREQLGSVAIVVEDEPTIEQLASVRAGGLFGLYQGVPRTNWGADAAPVPSKITIFRGPLERASRDGPSLAAAVAEVVRHEIAHHLGIDDRRLVELARERRR
jgi:predicted Zn-dependent protease with MMP-like domain